MADNQLNLTKEHTSEASMHLCSSLPIATLAILVDCLLILVYWEWQIEAWYLVSQGRLPEGWPGRLLR